MDAPAFPAGAGGSAPASPGTGGEPRPSTALVPRRAAGTSLARTARFLCASLHDLSPAMAPLLPRMVDLCRDAGVERLSLLVVPNWHGEAPLEANSSFCDALRRLAEEGCEVVLHGYTHRAEARPRGPWSWVKATYFAAGEAEFFALDAPEAARRLDAGRADLSRARLPAPAGFVAPAWLASRGARAAMAAAGLAYHEDTLRLHDLARRRSYLSPVIGFGPRRAWEREALIAYARLMSRALSFAPVLRVALHPVDVGERRTARTAARLLAREACRREPVTYVEALARLAG